jgi:8-oxo-dGTP pyrophosphatase MutT (NUDIX family)
MQAEDGGPLQAAIRETWEEVGVDLQEEARLIGFLDELPAVRSGGIDRRLVVSPFVFACPRRPQLRPNHEVAGYYWWNIERLLSGEGRGEKEWNWRGQAVQLPAVRLEGAELWGMTLRMVDELLGSLREGEDERQR